MVLDPFSGSGVTVATAEALGRQGIGIDLAAAYHDLARVRVERPHRPTARRSRSGRPAATLPGFGDDPDPEPAEAPR